MKIVHITTVHRPYDIRIFHKQIQSLHLAGYEVSEIACCEQDHIKDGVAIQSIPKPKSRYERMTLTAYRAMRRALQADADIYHIHDPELLPWALLLRIRGKKIIFDMHENISKAVLNKHWIPVILRKPLSKLVRAVEACLLWRVPIVFAENSYRDYFSQVKDFEIVLNYPRFEMLQNIKEKKFEQTTLVYLGGISKERGIKNTILATNSLRASGYDVQFKCIGAVSTDLKNYFENLVEPQSTGHIHFLGQLPPEEAYKVVAASHIGLSILLPTPNYVGSFATKILEYMGMGLPVIASDFQVNKDVIEHEEAGLCVDARNVKDVVEALKNLLDHPATYQKMSENGRRSALKNYSWEGQFKNLKNLYER